MTRRPIRTPLRALILCLAVTAAGAPRALADGDPASDILLAENVFYPYTPPTAVALQRDLDGATAAAARVGVPVKVALIASPVDLGVITALWQRPQEYAEYLDEEISFGSPQPLLVVMPDGYGGRSLTPREVRALASLPAPAGRTSDDLATAALTAIRRLAAADGHPIPLAATAAGDGGDSLLLLTLLTLAALIIAGAVSAVTLRRRAPATRRARSAGARRLPR